MYSFYGGLRRGDECDDDNDDAHQNDSDRRAAVFRGLRPAGAATGALVRSGAGAGVGSTAAQRVRLGRPAFQRRGRILRGRQGHADVHHRKVVARDKFRRLPRRAGGYAMN